MIDHIPTDYLLTESIKSTELQRQTNYFPIIKTLPEKSFPLTLSSLLLSQSFSLPATVNSPTPLISSHNLPCPQLDFEHEVSSRLPIVTLSSINKMKSSSKQGEKRKITPTESVSSKDSLKNLSSASIFMYP